MNIEGMRPGGAPSRSIADCAEPAPDIINGLDMAASLGGPILFSRPPRLWHCYTCGTDFIGSDYLTAHTARDHASLADPGDGGYDLS